MASKKKTESKPTVTKPTKKVAASAAGKPFAVTVTAEKPKAKKVQYKTLNEALFAFQGLGLIIPRNGEGKTSDGRTYRYATLDDTLKIVIPALQSVGLMLTQPVYGEKLHTSLVHIATGDKIESDIAIGNPDRTQDLGSRITYLRRYQITSMLSLTLEDDTDANPAKIAVPKNDVRENTVPVAGQNAESNIVVPKTADNLPERKEGTPTRSEAFLKANAAIDTCMGVEALGLIRANIARSTRITDGEKEELVTILEAKEHALIRQ